MQASNVCLPPVIAHPSILASNENHTISVRTGATEFLKVNTGSWEWRDAYQRLLALRWLNFAAFVVAVYIALNLIFATFTLKPNCIAGMATGSFLEAFFFSVQTLATVGYGHMYPQTLYGHIVTTIEIMSGTFLLAVMTGLIFVRFSRPTARIVFSKSVIIGPLWQADIDGACR